MRLDRCRRLTARALACLIAGAVVVVASSSWGGATPHQRVSASAPNGAACPLPSRAEPEPVPKGSVPLVLVHGWTGDPASMSTIGSRLESEFGSAVSVRYFDYHADSVRWAAERQIAPCLADYLHHASAQSGLPAVVIAHSMGGLAVRFASSAEVVTNPLSKEQVSDVVTIASPHRGSPWGGTVAAEAKQTLEIIKSFGAMPYKGTAASCLASHAGGTGMPKGCASPPYLPPEVNLLQIEGANAVHRDLFGHVLYSIDARGDGIVLTDSASGYPGSAGQPTPTGYRLDHQTVSCGMRASVQKGLLETALTGPQLPLLELWLRALYDTATMDSVLAGRLDAASGPLWAAMAVTSPCSHGGLLTQPGTTKHVVPIVQRAIDQAAQTWNSDELLNVSLPARTCVDTIHETGWSHDDPIVLSNGSGEARTATGDYGGASVLDTEILGQTDMNGDGTNDAVILISCSGSPIELCCAGRTSTAKVVAVLHRGTDGEPVLTGPTLWGGESFPGDEYGPVERTIRTATLDGSTIETTEYHPYPEMLSDAEVGGDPGADRVVRWQLQGGTWIMAS